MRTEPRESSALRRLARSVIRHRRKVMFAWLVCFAAGGYAASQLTSRLSYDFSLPGQPAYETGVKIMNLYGNGGNTTPSVLVVTVASGQSVKGDGPAIASALSAAHRANPEVRIVDLANTGIVRSSPRMVAPRSRTSLLRRTMDSVPTSQPPLWRPAWPKPCPATASG